MAPNTPTRSEVDGRPGSMRGAMLNGISDMWVTSWRWTTGQNWEVDHFGIRTTVAPTPRAGKNDQLCALTWKNGR